MPYDVNADLPPSVRSHFPEHAQDIFREAFNHAYAAHAHDPRQEEAAFRIAWAAVKRVYEKIGDEWVERRVGGGLAVLVSSQERRAPSFAGHGFAEPLAVAPSEQGLA